MSLLDRGHLARGLRAGLSRFLLEASALRLGMGRPRNGDSVPQKPRVIATATHDFPIYSQTFVYQELKELSEAGFALRLLYSKLGSRDDLPSRCSVLWGLKRRTFLNDDVALRDMERMHRRMPGRTQALVRLLCDASGMSYHQLVGHPHFRQAFSFTRLVRSFGPQYIHSYFFYERSFFCMVAGFMLGIPRGLSCYADHLLDDYELKLVPLQIELSDLVVATSERIKSELLEICPGKDPNDIIVKPNAVESTHFPVVERDEPRGAESFRVVTVARLEPKKGLTHLVDAVGALRERGLSVELHLVGEADSHSEESQEYARELGRQIGRLGLESQVHLEGRKKPEEIVELLHGSHLFAAPFVELESGDKDGIPTALLEAMATGSVVVASDAGSMTEVIDHERDGLVVAQRDAGQLAAAIERLIGDAELRRRLGGEAAAKVRRQFDVSVCEGVFHDLVRAKIAQRESVASDKVPGADAVG